MSATLATGLAMAGCSAGGGSTESDNTLTLWDNFTQYDEASPYGQLVSACESETGITIERTADPDTETKFLQAASSDTTPNMILLDNPAVARFADTGLLIDNEESGLDTTGVLPNILASAELDGRTYGSSIGSNTLALFYNADLFEAAGIEPPTSWEELTSSAAALTSGDVKGISFSAIGTEEGTFQFLPFFWGSGATLDDIASPEAVSALALWTDFVQSGSASDSVVNANQQDVRDQFLAGAVGMMVNGTWQLSALDEAGINYGVVPIPGVDGGAAPSPLGGEFIEIVASNADDQELSTQFAQCMIDADNLGAWAEGQSYVLPYEDAATAQAEADPALVPWVEAITVAEGRTSELGIAYPDTSQAVWTAMQEALTGSKDPQTALDDAAASLED